MFSILQLFASVTITMTKRGGIFYIPGKVNGINLDFVFDTGASNVFISLTEAMFMLKNGYLSYEDFGNTAYSKIANGELVENTEVLLKEIEIGPIKITNVKAFVSHTIEAPLLLGQSAIQKLGPFKLDGNLLIISNGNDVISNQDINILKNQAYIAACEETLDLDKAILLTKKSLELTRDHKERSWIWCNLGIAYYQSFEYEKAIEAYNNALAEDLTAELPAYNLGVCFFDAEMISEALQVFNSFIDQHPNPQPQNFLVKAYEYKGRCHAKLGETKLAENAFRKSLSLLSSFTPSPFLNCTGEESLAGLANLYANADKYVEACPLYEKALGFKPYAYRNIKRWFEYGMCLVNSKQYENALSAFKNSHIAFMEHAELFQFFLEHPEDDNNKEETSLFLRIGIEAKIWVARLLLPNDLRAGIQQYEKLSQGKIPLDFFTPTDYIWWSSAYTDLSNTTQALNKKLEILKLGLSKLPDNPDLLFAYSLAVPDNDPIGLDYLMKILNQEFSYQPKSFDYATVYNNIAWRLCLDNKNLDALPYAEQSVKLNATHDYSWETLGEIYYNLGRFYACIRAMTECIKLGGNSQKSAYEFRAKSYQKIGKIEEANRDIEIAKTL